MLLNTYSDISPRTTAYADRRLLTRAVPNNILGRFGQVRPLPRKKSTSIKFRRYNKLAVATTPLVEGVTPDGKALTKTDITATLKQYGDFIRITDVVMDTHEDPVLQESTDILGEQAGETIDVLRAGVLKAGTNVLYANGTDRTDVNSVIAIGKLRTAIRTLKRQEAKKLTKIAKASVGIGTTPIPDSFFAVCHADLEPDLVQLSGWTPVEKYSDPSIAIPGEIGSVMQIRFVLDNNLSPWADAGGAAATNSTLSTTGTSSDVYPILIFGANAYGVVAFGGKSGARTYVANPKASDSDPLAQRGSVGWKTYNATAILNDLWMLRIEVAAVG